MPIKRVAVNTGAGFVPGMNAVLKGMALAAYEQGWEVVGIRDGFAGLLHPDRYPDGGVIPLSRDLVESLHLDVGAHLGQSAKVDPFHVRRVDEDGMVEEVDESDRVLQALGDAQIDALVSVVGRRGLTIFHKLHRKGLRSVCIPQSIEGDIASTMVSFGFNSALSFTIDMLDRTRQAARSARRVGVVEVLGGAGFFFDDFGSSLFDRLMNPGKSVRIRSDAVTLDVTMNTLEDGALYASEIVLGGEEPDLVLDLEQQVVVLADHLQAAHVAPLVRAQPPRHERRAAVPEEDRPSLAAAGDVIVGDDQAVIADKESGTVPGLGDDGNYCKIGGLDRS